MTFNSFCFTHELKQQVFRCSGKGNDIANVLHSRDIHDEAFKAQTESGVLTSAIPAQIQIPLQTFLMDAHFLHSILQDVQPFLTLRAADQLTHRRD